MQFSPALLRIVFIGMFAIRADADDTAKVAALFASAAEHGGIVTIPPGDYALDGGRPVRLASHTTVFAYGARFHLPETLGDKARAVLFSGENVSDFRGGRGSWINQPRNFVLTGNVFLNNTTKNERDPHRGRRTFITGDYEQKPELYFTLYEREGHYGPVIVRDNIFVPGPECGSPTVTFAPGGCQILFKDNIFREGPATIAADPSCTEVDIRDNPGATLRREPVDFNHGRR